MLKVAKRLLWDAERFGFTPKKILEKFNNFETSKIMLISIPKAGTHLLERVFCLHRQLYRKLLPTLHSGNIEGLGGLKKILQETKPGQVLCSHLWYSEQYLEWLSKYDFKIFFMIRDPRDILISLMFFILKNKNFPAHTLLKGEKEQVNQLRICITGNHAYNLLSMRDTLKKFDGWYGRENVNVIRFEKLINKSSRINTIQDAYRFANIKTDDNYMRWLSEKIISDASPTFRRGESGSWKTYFPDAHCELKQILKKEVSDFVIRYKYETNNQW